MPLSPLSPFGPGGPVMSIPTNVAIAQFPDVPVASVNRRLETVGIIVPSHVTVIFELVENPEQTTVVDAKPKLGLKLMSASACSLL